VETAHKVSGGQFRRLMKTILLFEDKIRGQKAVSLSAKDIKEIDQEGAHGSK
jgi:hypothetical protein